MKNLEPKESVYFDILKLPKQYFIDKYMLKKNYYEVSKKNHPDLLKRPSEGEISSNIINKAYQILNDDFLRAKLFTVSSEALPHQFLDECLEMEDKIKKGIDLKGCIVKKIQECKNNYFDPVWVSKWAYYRRLLDIINGR